MLSRDEIEQGIRHFSGTESYHRLSLPRTVLATDGVKWLCDNADCFWLFDIITSIAPKYGRKAGGFLLCKLRVEEDQSALFTADDGNGKVLYRQRIGFTDFPLDNIMLFCEMGAAGATPAWIVMLPNER